MSMKIKTRCRHNGTRHDWPAACWPWWVTLHMRRVMYDDRRQRPLLYSLALRHYV